MMVSWPVRSSACATTLGGPPTQTRPLLLLSYEVLAAHIGVARPVASSDDLASWNEVPGHDGRSRGPTPLPRPIGCPGRPFQLCCGFRVYFPWLMLHNPCRVCNGWRGKGKAVFHQWWWPPRAGGPFVVEMLTMLCCYDQQGQGTMADDAGGAKLEDYDFSGAAAGASDCFPLEAGQIKKGG